MLTPRSTLTRRVLAALDASPSRIPVLLGGCGSGRTTLLQQLRDRIGRTSAQYIDVERTATTPERFLRAIVAHRRSRAADAAVAGARAAFDATLALFNRTPRRRQRAGDLPARRVPRAPDLRKLSRACAACCTTSSTASRRARNRFVLTSRYTARTLRLLRDRSARFEVIHMPALTRRGDDRRPRAAGARATRDEAEYLGAHRPGARRRTAGLRPRPRRRARGDARPRRARRRGCGQRARGADGDRRRGSPGSATSRTSCGCTARAATARSRPFSTSSPRKKG